MCNITAPEKASPLEKKKLGLGLTPEERKTQGVILIRSIRDNICYMDYTYSCKSPVWKIIMFEYSGWFTFVIEPMGYVKMFAFGLLEYLIVMMLDFKRIQKIPMEEALKNVE